MSLKKSSLKQRHLTPSDVSMPQVEKKTVHLPVPLNWNTSINGGTAAPYSLPSAPSEVSTRHILDGFLLLESTGMNLPDDARMADLTNRGLQGVVEDDLEFFGGVVYMDISDNSLPFKAFGKLPRLKELRMACNNITDVLPTPTAQYQRHNPEQPLPSLVGYEKLQYLDLSYNHLTQDSVMALMQIRGLKELDLTGNDLKRLPPNMCDFVLLERLLIEHNKIQDNKVFYSLGAMPNLRVLGMAYNFISKVPNNACAGDQFRLLETFDLAFNYVGNEVDLQGVVVLPRLTSFLIYGNPILGPTGEDALKMYVAGLCDRAYDARTDSNSNIEDVDIITEIPRRRDQIRKDGNMGRMATYQKFDIVKVDTGVPSSLPGAPDADRTAHHWREQQGAGALFSSAVAIAKANLNSTVPDTTTFMTSTGNEEDEDNHGDRIISKVMEKVAKGMGIASSAELMSLDDRLTLPVAGETPKETVPSTLFRRSLGAPQPLAQNTVSVNTAISALRYAVRFPLTNYTEIPTKGFLPPKDYVRSTCSVTAKKLPRIGAPSFAEKFAKTDKGAPEAPLAALLTHDRAFGAPQSPSHRSPKKDFSQKNTTVSASESNIHHIEELLDNMNEYTTNMVSSTTKTPLTLDEHAQLLKKFAKPTHQISGLIKMVDEVVHELDT